MAIYTVYLTVSLNDILDISKIEAGQMTLNYIDFNLSTTLKDIQFLFKASCENKLLSWSVQSFDGPIYVNGDESKIRQVIINLVGNAIKFTDEGGVLLLATQAGNDQFRFEIKDTGKGIPDKNFESIFDPFKQEKQGFEKGGTGLGLAISQMQAKLMEGKIEVKSKLGIGSSFIFTLPLLPAKAKVKELKENTRRVVRLSEGYEVKALVVDEMKENREVLKKLLEDVGIKVIEAENGKVAIEKFDEERPDVIFMDIWMPVMNGVEAIRRLKQIYSEKELNIIIVSASALKHEQEKFESLGCQEILLKPFQFEQVFESIQRLLNVEYQFEQVDTVSSVVIDYSKINIPKNIISEIKESCTSYNLTILEENFKLLTASNSSETSFINKLKEYKSSFDFQNMKILLEKLDDTL
jgi:CheY-like chemotaxis protein